MPTCPNCGSGVEDGDACGVCGGSGSYDYNQKKDESFHFRIEYDEKINSNKLNRYMQKLFNILKE